MRCSVCKLVKATHQFISTDMRGTVGTDIMATKFIWVTNAHYKYISIILKSFDKKLEQKKNPRFSYFQLV